MSDLIDDLAFKLSKQIPRAAGLVCVVGLMASGKSSIVKALGGLGFKTFDPVQAMAAGGVASMSNPKSGDEMIRLAAGEYNRQRPDTLVVDGLPKTIEQLETLQLRASLYKDDFIIVHVEATPSVRLSRYAAGAGLSERIRRNRILKVEEEATKPLYVQMAKFVPWYLKVQTG